MSNAGFWNFSLTHYGLPGVADACLTLQDNYDLDVNMLLCCLWYGHCYGELSEQQLDRLLQFSSKWSGGVVKPLRETRRWIKQQRPDLQLPLEQLAEFRNQVKQLELRAEQLQQEHLQELLLPCGGFGGDCGGVPGRCSSESNLQRYLQKLDVKPAPDLNRLLAILLDAVH